MDYRQMPLAQDSGNLPLTNKMTGISAELAGTQEFLQEYGTKSQNMMIAFNFNRKNICF